MQDTDTRGDTYPATLRWGDDSALNPLAAIERFKLTVNTAIERAPLPPITRGYLEVSGTIVATFTTSKLHQWFVREQRGAMNRLLRGIRPSMPKRKWRRLRAKIRTRVLAK